MLQTVSLRLRMMVSIVALVIVLVLGMSWLTVHSQRQAWVTLSRDISQLTGSASGQQASALQAVLQQQMQASQEALQTKARSLAALVANLAPAALLTFDTNALNSLCQQAGSDRDVVECQILDAQGKPAATFHQEPATTGTNQPEVSRVTAGVEQNGAQVGQVVLVVSLASVKEQGARIQDGYAALQSTLQQVSGAMEGGLQAQSRSQAQEAATLALKTGSAAVALGVICALWISGSVARPLRQTVSVLKRVAKGDLTQRLEVHSRDEIGQMARSLSTAVRSMNSALRAIEESAEHIASSTEEISAAATQSAQGAGRQKDRTNEVAVAMEQMSTTMLRVSENSKQAAQDARSASVVARKGGQVVDASLARMGVIASSFSDVADSIRELGQRSERIGKIVNSIDEIADQTNLLALNAAIEAARAGDRGRGFAVVADEVRKLADKTTKATKEIGETIASIQEGTRAAVQAMELGNQEVSTGVEQTTQAGAALREIIDTTAHVGEMVASIATAATEQSAAVQQVRDHVTQIAGIAGESDAGACQTAQACQDLSNLAFDLQQFVGRFQLNHDEAPEPASATRARGGQARPFSPAAFRYEGNGPAARPQEGALYSASA
jgi:methyl-accepting chemotaxis protein